MRIRHTRAAPSIVLIGLLVAAVVSPASSATRPAASEMGGVCVPVVVPAVGRACRQSDGMLRVTGPGGAVVLTHGPDPMPPPVDAPPSGLNSRQAYVWPGQVKPKCVKDPKREFHGHVIYARASDRPDRYAKMLTEIRAMVSVVNGKLRQEAAAFSRVTDLRFDCVGSNVRVSRVRLQTRDREATFETIFSELLVAGFDDARAKYWVWYDGPPRFGASGVGTSYSDSSRSSENRNNYGQMWAVTFGLGLRQNGQHTMMHEAGHNLGAVQDDAPNSSGQGHCVDDQDVMCYPEPGNTYAASRFKSTVCRTEHFDCRNNDYFNPRPKSRTYIATHWNIGSPLNRFISGCQFSTGTMSAPTPLLVDDPNVSATRGVSRSCWGHPFALSGVDFTAYDALGPLSSVNLLQRSPAEFSVCFYKGSTRQKCYENDGTKMGSVPSGATKMKIWMTEGIGATYFFNAV